MAKHVSKLKDFFEGMRRHCTLQDWRPLKTKAGERRMKLMISMPLSTQSSSGMPEDFTEEYVLMVREKSKVNLSKVAVELEGALVSIFSTDTVKSPAVKVNGATLNSFRIVGDGIDEKRTVDLEFVAYVPWTDSLRDWCGIHLHEDFFAEVVPSQMELKEEKPSKPAKASNKKPKKDSGPQAVPRPAKSGELVE